MNTSIQFSTKCILRPILLFSTLLICSLKLYAQSPPQKMNYQAVLRNSSNQLITNQSVGMKISIIQGSASGSVVFTEQHSGTTNMFGIINLEIGGGTPVAPAFQLAEKNHQQ